ncbi:MAG: helix-turn-helix domain-containing protein [Candidatus Latescibacterota bacterium]
MSSRQVETEIDHHIPRGDEELKFWFKEPYQSIATRRETNHNQRALHKHDFIELVIVLAGHGVHLIEQTRHPIGPGDTFVIPPNIRHGYADTQKLSLINILMRSQHLQVLERECVSMPGFYALFKLEPRVRAMDQFNGQLRLPQRALVEIEDWIESLEAATRETTPLACSRARGFLQLIVGNLCMQYETLGSLDSTKLLLIANCIRYMDSNLGASLHLSDLARAAGMSERSLSRNFHAIVGQSPIEYLLNMRLQRAEELLLAGPAPIAQIGYEVGFADANYFTRQFRKLHGLSPREFRKKHRHY